MFCFMSNTGKFRICRGSNGVKSLWEFDQLVAVAHPDLEMVLQTSKKLVNVSLTVESFGGHIGVTIFASDAGDNVALVPLVSDFLQTVADSENRDAEIEERGVTVRSTIFVNTEWTTGENLFFFTPMSQNDFLVNLSRLFPLTIPLGLNERSASFWVHGSISL
jgi:hypothetical protein